MIPSLRLISVRAIILFGLLPPSVFAQQPMVENPLGANKEPSRENILEHILNYPFASNDDMRMISGSCLILLAASQREWGQSGDASLRDFLAEVATFTSTDAEAGEKVSIVNFGESPDSALSHLREQVHMPPPEGGAILRVYQTKQSMPESIRVLFREQVQGVTRWCRFIAVNAEDKSAQELADTISHELTHAYLASSLGLNNDKLPKWFHEGVALYLSDAKDRYVSQTGFGVERIAWSPGEYEEYKLVFRYLKATVGSPRIDEFIRQVLEARSANDPMQALIGVASYSELRQRALEWKERQQRTLALLVFGGLILMASGYVLQIRRRRARLGAEAAQELEQAENRKREYTLRAVRDLEQMYESQTIEELLIHEQAAVLDIEKAALEFVVEARALAKAGKGTKAEQSLKKALQMAPQSQRVRIAVQDVSNEMNGIVL